MGNGGEDVLRPVKDERGEEEKGEVGEKLWCVCLA